MQGTRRTTSEVRKDFAETLNRVTYRGERIILERHGKDVAAIVSLADLELLEALEDRFDIEEARRALADPDQTWTALDDVRKELGL